LDNSVFTTLGYHETVPLILCLIFIYMLASPRSFLKILMPKPHSRFSGPCFMAVNSGDMEWITNSHPQLSQLAPDPLALWILLFLLIVSVKPLPGQLHWPNAKLILYFQSYWVLNITGSGLTFLSINTYFRLFIRHIKVLKKMRRQHRMPK
jgi:hypothetical protein